MKNIVFIVERDSESGGFTARWDDPGKGGITTQGKDLHHLEEMIRDAVLCHFDEGKAPHSVALHFVTDPELVVA